MITSLRTGVRLRLVGRSTEFLRTNALNCPSGESGRWLRSSYLNPTNRPVGPAPQGSAGALAPACHQPLSAPRRPCDRRGHPAAIGAESAARSARGSGGAAWSPSRGVALFAAAATGRACPTRRSRLGRRPSSPQPVDAPASSPPGETYVVRPGDTLWSIAAAIAPDSDPRPVVGALRDANASRPTPGGAPRRPAGLRPAASSGEATGDPPAWLTDRRR